MNIENIYNFQFSEMEFSLKTKWPVRITKNFIPFYMQENAQRDQCMFECVVCDKMENIQGVKVNSSLEYDVIKKKDGSYIRLFKDHKENDQIYAVSESMLETGKTVISVLKGNEQLFASKYKLYLPTEDELRAEIENQKTIFELQQQNKKELDNN